MFMLFFSICTKVNGGWDFGVVWLVCEPSDEMDFSSGRHPHKGLG